MKEYINTINQIDQIICEYRKLVNIIEKDYPNDQLNTLDYNSRKKRKEILETSLINDLKNQFNKLDNIIKKVRKEQPHFNNTFNLQKRLVFPDYFISGRVQISSENFEQQNLPKIATFPLENSVYSYNEDSILDIHQYILRVLQISPLNKIDFLLIDPKTLGKSFNFIRPILDNKFIYNQRILTYADEIEESLKKLVDYMENLLQKQLSGMKNWKEYNRINYTNVLPLKVLVINGFPQQFTSNSLLYVSRIVKYGAITGINCFLIMDKIADDKKNLKEFEEIILNNSKKIDDLEYILNNKCNHIKLKNSLEPMPKKEDMNIFLDQINNVYKKESTIKGEIDIFWNQDKFMKSTSINGINIPIGWDENENEIDFEIGFEYSEHHTLIGGRSGSGKSNLLNVIIQNISYFYAPDEVELFLLDYKDGVEFNTYTKPYLKHASLIAINSNVSYGVSFLKYILLEKDRRSELFKLRGVKDYKEYRTITNNKLSRILIIIDEFQTLFSTKERNQVENMFAEILRKGRSFGIHILLSTQTLSGIDVGSISQLKSQIGNRIALPMGMEESMAFLSMNNEAASKLNGKPEAIYNNKAGNIAGNKKVYIPYASKDALQILLHKIENISYPKSQKIYDGEEIPCIHGINLMQNDNFSLILGKEQDFVENEFNIIFHKEYGSNIIITGKNKQEKQSIIDIIMLNIKNNQFIKNLYYINNDFDINFEKVYDINIFENEIKEKSVILIDSFDTLSELHPKSNLGFSSFGAESKILIAEKFKEIVENGYRKDIYTIIFVDNYKRLSMLNEFFELFNHRMAFSLNSEEVNSFLKLDYNISTQTVRNNKGVYTNLLTSNTKEFKFFKDIEND